MRLISPVGHLLVATFATAMLGQPMLGEDSKLSGSNVMPVVFCALVLPLFMVQQKTVDRRVIAFFLFFNASALLSFGIFAFRYAWPPNFLVLLFQDVEILFALLMLWYAHNNYEEFRGVVRAGIYASLLVGTLAAVYELATSRYQLAFGMDDKSHTAVLFCTEAYMLVRFYGGKLDHLVAFALVGCALLTVSRESVFLIPPMLLALSLRSRAGFVFGVVLLIGIVFAFAVAGDLILDTFTVLNRLTSLERVTGENSTVTHFLLIRSAVEMKFSDLGCFLFGIGPGNYSKALSTYRVLLPEMQAMDPVLASAALEGRTPMHSVTFSLLLDMNIVLFLLVVFLVLKALGHLLQTRNYMDLIFVVGFLGAATFYSLHNKAYFYLMVATLIALIGYRQPGPVRSASQVRLPDDPTQYPGAVGRVTIPDAARAP
jgi:hypothetical protein